MWSRYIPLNVAPILKQMLFKNKAATVLTSATLATNKDDFTLIRSRIGFPEDGREIALDSPFNYPKASTIHVANRHTNPKRIANSTKR